MNDENEDVISTPDMNDIDDTVNKALNVVSENIKTVFDSINSSIADIKNILVQLSVDLTSNDPVNEDTDSDKKSDNESDEKSYDIASLDLDI